MNGLEVVGFSRFRLVKSWSISCCNSAASSASSSFDRRIFVSGIMDSVIDGWVIFDCRWFTGIGVDEEDFVETVFLNWFRLISVGLMSKWLT